MGEKHLGTIITDPYTSEQMKMRFVGAVCLLAGFAYAGFQAGWVTPEPPYRGVPIGIEQEPGDVAVGGNAKFAGAIFNPGNEGGNRIRAVITDPKGGTRTQEFATGAQDQFVFRIDNCIVGRYRVVFQGLDGVGGTVREFNVVDWDQVQRALDRKFREQLDRAVRVAEGIRRRVNSAPAGPNREEARQRLDRVSADHRRSREYVNQMLTVAQRLDGLATAPADIRTEAANALSDFSAATREFETECEGMREFEARTRDTPSTCDSLETAAEGLKFFATATQALLKPLDLLKDAIKDKIVPKSEAKQPPPNEDIKFAVNTLKTEAQAAVNGGDAILRSLPGLSRSTAEFVLERLFKSYCSVIEGPVTADFSVDAKDNGKPFYKYSVKLEAKMKLWAEKSQVAGPQGMEYSGRLEGGAIKVSFSDNIFNVEKLPAGSKLILKKSFTPPVMSKPGENLIGSGQIARGVNPGHFNVRYLGNLTEAGMKLKQESVSDDFTAAFVNRVMIVAVLPGGILPGVKTFKFPIQKGAWIIDRSTKGAFELPRTPDASSVILKKEVTRNEVTASGIKVDWKVSWNLKGDK